MEFDQYLTPDDERKFIELYNVQHLQSNVLDSVNKVHITTIQHLCELLTQLNESLAEINAKQIDILSMRLCPIPQKRSPIWHKLIRFQTPGLQSTAQWICLNVSSLRRAVSGFVCGTEQNFLPTIALHSI
jgi:hypothetical protein